MAKVIDFQKRKAAGASKPPQEPPEPRQKDKGSMVARLMKKAFWHTLSGFATWLYSVASSLGVAITLLAKFVLSTVAIMIVFAFFSSESPDYDRILELTLWYPIIIGGCLAYKGLVYLLNKLASHLATTANQRTWR